jgi:hypothetical protein
VHRNDLDPKVLAYQYLQTLPELARGQGNTFWVIPSEVTSALSGIAQAFGPGAPAARPAQAGAEVAVPEPDVTRPVGNGWAHPAGDRRVADHSEAGKGGGGGPVE